MVNVMMTADIEDNKSTEKFVRFRKNLYLCTPISKHKEE